ncbi:PLP-dependent aminotransferase family protein [Vulcanisaeta souniana]|uniref:Aminotransferase n=1 Tax=Vulcanisaeta souniana JCM 11219 TaxID=1293586 RepID=A0A830E1Q9_9CREN|nr:PLP-dependent aminotransferase family protein [Vulcanisaeta souniana]BDR91514.1 aminotransferase [Vulcanisaeta souniana JCM 11219]GGI73756.1 aminotransferase [Vulcanisaeta souniana JCM 11219]
MDIDRFLSDRSRLMKASEIRELLKWVNENVISFGGGMPDPSSFPVKEIMEITRDVLSAKAEKALQYGTTGGILELKEELAKFMGKVGIKINGPEDIIITVGSQEALDIIGRLFINPGDYIITESPTYLAALQAFRIYGPRMVGIPMDSEGVRVDLLEEAVRKIINDGGKLKFIYVVPTGQNPTGITMSDERRKALLDVASRYDLAIVEDDPYGYIYFGDDEPPARLKAMDSEGRVIYLSTFSKIAAPGLRLGWVAASSEVIRWFELAKQSIDLHTSTLNQYIAAELLRRGVIEKNIPRTKEIYRSKRDLMLQALSEYMPSGVSWTRPSAGMFIWLTTPERIDTGEMLGTAIKKYGVAYVPGKSFYPNEERHNDMRLNFTYPTPQQIFEGIKRLALVIAEYLNA